MTKAEEWRDQPTQPPTPRQREANPSVPALGYFGSHESGEQSPTDFSKDLDFCYQHNILQGKLQKRGPVGGMRRREARAEAAAQLLCNKHIRLVP